MSESFDAVDFGRRDHVFWSAKAGTYFGFDFDKNYDLIDGGDNIYLSKMSRKIAR